jgi:hypothetical protein
MASDRKFHTNVNSTDIIQQSEDGGGIKLTTDGKFIFGAKHQNVIDQLSDENYTGTVDVNANNQSFIAVMNENSHAIDVEVPINHFTSLEIPTDNIVTATQNNGTDCSKEFDDDAKIFLTHENNYSDGGDSNVKVGDKNKYNLINLGWGPYGGAGSTLTAATAKYLSDYWNTNSNNPPQPSEQTKLIKNLPPGLRSMAVQFSYNAGAWWTRMLVVSNKLNSNLGITIKQSMNIDSINSSLSDDANLAFANGSAYLRDETTGNKTSTIVKLSETMSKKDRALLFVNQYDDIIALYNNDKAKFLTTLETEYRRYYKVYVQGQKDRNEYIQNNPTKVGARKVEDRWLPNSKGGKSEDLDKFYTTYVDLAKKQADKYVGCQYAPTPTAQTPQTQQTIPTTTPTPTPTTTTPPTPEEEQEGIYDANFLPMVETDYIDLNKSDCSTAAIETSDEILSGKIKVFDGDSPSDEDNSAGDDDVKGNNPAIIAIVRDMNEALKWVKLGGKGVVGKSNAKGDYDAGRLNPNTVKDIGSAAKACGFTVVITTAKTGHKPTGFHVVGWGCDIAIVNGGGYGKGSNPNFKPDGDKLKDALISLGYKWMTRKGPNGTPGETSSPTHKCVIWQSADHYNHLHVSNTIEYPGWNNPNPIKAKWKNLQIDGATGKPK